MPGGIEGELPARRKFRKTLVAAKLEIKRAILMPQHDGGGDRRLTGAQGDDLALAGLSERCCGAADKGGIALILSERGAALALPAARLQCHEGLDRGCDLVGRARHVETDSAVFGKAMALPAQLFQFF